MGGWGSCAICAAPLCTRCRAGSYPAHIGCVPWLGQGGGVKDEGVSCSRLAGETPAHETLTTNLEVSLDMESVSGQPSSSGTPPPRPQFWTRRVTTGRWPRMYLTTGLADQQAAPGWGSPDTRWMAGRVARPTRCQHCRLPMPRWSWALGRAHWAQGRWTTEIRHLHGQCQRTALGDGPRAWYPHHIEGLSSLPPGLLDRVRRACKGQGPLRNGGPGGGFETRSHAPSFNWRRWTCPPGVLTQGWQDDGRWPAH